MAVVMSETACGDVWEEDMWGKGELGLHDNPRDRKRVPRPRQSIGRMGVLFLHAHGVRFSHQHIPTIQRAFFCKFASAGARKEATGAVGRMGSLVRRTVPFCRTRYFPSVLVTLI